MNHDDNRDVHSQQKIAQLYQAAQRVRLADREAPLDVLRQYAHNWKAADLPTLQRRVADEQLRQFSEGVSVPVFDILAECLSKISQREISLLDVGCASGYYSEVVRSLENYQVTYHGCDYSEAMISCARQHYSNTDFSVADITDLPFDSNTFDVVVASGVLEHVPDHEQAVQEICRVASRYVIVHRLPVMHANRHVHTLGSQYSILTPRTRFAEQIILTNFANIGFRVKFYRTLPAVAGRSARSYLLETS